MSALQKYLKKDYLQKVLICIFGNLIMGIGIALTKMATLGNDPFNGSCMSVSAALNIPYTTYTLLFNTALFVFELLFGRKYIGFGTFVNWFLVCYVVDFFLPIWEKLVGTPDIFVGYCYLSKWKRNTDCRWFGWTECRKNKNYELLEYKTNFV